MKQLMMIGTPGKAFEGTHVRSWGSSGSGPGQFVLPHGIFVARDDRALVADRESDRIQIFDLNGDYVEEWTHLRRPTVYASIPAEIST